MLFFGRRLSTIPTGYARNQVLMVRVLVAFDGYDNTESIFTLLCLMLERRCDAFISAIVDAILECHDSYRPCTLMFSRFSPE